jgi:hypothetical protein
MVIPPEPVSVEPSPPLVPSVDGEPPLDAEPVVVPLPVVPVESSSASEVSIAVGDNVGVGVAIGLSIGAALSTLDPHVAVAPEWPTTKAKDATAIDPITDAATAARTCAMGRSERVNSHSVTERATSPIDAGKRTSPSAECCCGFPCDIDRNSPDSFAMNAKIAPKPSVPMTSGR